MLKYYTVTQLSKIVDHEDLNLVVMNFKELQKLENDKLKNNLNKTYFDHYVNEDSSLILKNQILNQIDLFDIVRFNHNSPKRNYYVIIPKITFILSEDFRVSINAVEFNKLPGSLIAHLVDNYHYQFCNDDELLYTKYEDRDIIELASGYFYYPTELSYTLVEKYDIIKGIKLFLTNNPSKTFQLLVKYFSFSTINLEITNELYKKYRLEKEEEVESMKDDLFSILSDCAADDELDRAQQKLNDNELNDWGEDGLWNID
jgi:hypothetical protein